jgi:hypothetical protein
VTLELLYAYCCNAAASPLSSPILALRHLAIITLCKISQQLENLFQWPKFLSLLRAQVTSELQRQAASDKDQEACRIQGGKDTVQVVLPVLIHSNLAKL